ncbi:MAG: methyltransferase domain-containing protein [Oscillospiraceae bacterium]|nr:methyltransferase domain-containing protein [Oscillospiraceae bacterium]
MYQFTDEFIEEQSNLEFLNANMMGPNAMRISEEMASHLDIREGMRVLDLGCGCGLSTLLLVQKFGVEVFAADLWISPTDNDERFKSLGIEDKTVPLLIDATKGLPFANEYFDILFSVDAYQYFGRTPEMLPSLIPFVKKGGYIAVAVPGWKSGIDSPPEEILPFFEAAGEEGAVSFQNPEFWKNLWSECDGIELLSCTEMDANRQAWDEWLTSGHPIAHEDIPMMEAEGGKYFTLIQLIAKVK